MVWENLALTYGQVFSVKLGRIEAVVVSGYDAVRQVLCNNDFDGRPDGFFFRFRAFYKRLGELTRVNYFTKQYLLILLFINKGIVFVDGDAWTEQRKFFMQHLRKMGFDGDLMEKLVIEEVDDLIKDIKKKSEVRVLQYIQKANHVSVLYQIVLGW